MRFRRPRALHFLLLPAFLVASSAAQNPTPPAQEFADKILGHLQSRSAILLTVNNLSSLAAGSVADIRRDLESRLRATGVRFVGPEQKVEEVRVTLSENVRGYLWVAQIGHDDSWEVVIMPVPMLAAERSANPAVLRRTPLWSQAEPILDAVAEEASGVLLVLSPERITLYQRQAGRWELQQAAGIAHQSPWPRDLRGRLVLRRDGGFSAYLPGVQCNGSIQPAFNANCEEKDDPWPISFEPATNAFFGAARNFFTGTLVPAANDGKLRPFYTAAALSQAGSALWIFASLDGMARVVGQNGDLVATVPGWGSDIAGLRSNCGSGAQVVATRAGDASLPDALQAYEVVNREAVEVGLPVEMPGPITALWAAPDAMSATAVARNLKTGRYEAYSISMACGR